MTSDNQSMPTTIVDLRPAPTTIVGAPGTTIVGAPGTTVISDAAVDLTSVPPEVFQRFPNMRVHASGSEATVFTTDDDELGQVAIKIYRRHLRPTVSLIDQIRAGSEEHLVRLHESVSVGGAWVDVLEWIEAGSLDTLPRDVAATLLIAIVQEMTDAIEHFHSLGLVHRDIKPANILVRSFDPLDLVLADFGLAAFASDAVDLRAQDRSIHYSSPETNSGVPGMPPADWWSLGMVVAELVMGRHPFTGLNDVEIVNHLAARDVDLSPISDPRWRGLVAGLLTRDAAHRWSSREVREWLAGNDPAVWQPSYAHPAYEFDGEQFRTARELAAGLGEKWDAAVELVGGSHGWTQLAQWLIGEAPGDSGRARVLDRVAATADADCRLFSLLRALAPDLVPVYRMFAIDPAGLEGLAGAAETSTTMTDELASVVSLFENHALALRDPAGVDLDHRWHNSWLELSGIIQGRIELGDQERATAKARLLAAECAPERTQALKSAANQAARREYRSIDWFDDLARRAAGSNAAAAAVLLLAPAAQSFLLEQRQQAESDRAERLRAARADTTDRYPRTRLWLGWSVVAMFVLAAASMSGRLVELPQGSWTVATSPTGRVELLEGTLATTQLTSADDTVPGLIGYLRFLFNPVWSMSLSAVGLTLWTRARHVGRPDGPTHSETERRSMQVVTVAAHLLLPVLIPVAAVLAYRYHRSRNAHTSSPAQRRRHYALMVASLGFLLHGVAILAGRIEALGEVMFQFPEWYGRFLFEVPAPVFATVNNPSEYGWLMWASFVGAAASFALGVRALGSVSDGEAIGGLAVSVVGLAALVPGALLAGFFPVMGAGIVVATILAVIVGLLIIGFFLMAGGE